MVALTYSRTSDQHVSLIRKELVDLTQDSQVAVVLNQLLYWCQRVKDFPLFLEEERCVTPESDSPLTYGWIYKTADELIAETLLTVTRPTMRKYLRILADEGWIEEKRNPDLKWDRTTFVRLNLKKIHNDLMALGYRVPGFEKGLFESDAQERNLTSKEENLTPEEENLTSKEENLTDQEKILNTKLENLTSTNLENLTAQEENLTSNEKNFTESEERNLTSNENNLTPKLRNLTDQKRNFPSKLKNLTTYTYTETTHKNTNRDHTQKTRARENFAALEKMLVGESVGDEMVRLWEHHVLQKLFPLNWQGLVTLTQERGDQLESFFAFHFKNDMRLWEQFCIRVKKSDFMMGGGPNGWKVSLDWILKDGNLLKVMEGNYDNSAGPEKDDSHDFSTLDNVKPNPARDAEKAAIIASIKDPVWKSWCAQLAMGVRLNECRMLHEPLSVSDLSAIAHAWFLECEDEKLVWIGSSDPSVLRRIEDLRLSITWVFAKEHPKARAIRTRLVSEINSTSNSQPLAHNPQPFSEGDISHDQ